MPARVRVIVLNFNGGEMVLRAIASVLDSRWPADAIEVVLVDNASTDGSAERVASQFPAVRIIRSSRNAGFPANNLAMADLTGVDFIALVNPDAFVEPDWLPPLVDAMRDDERIGAACPLMLFAARDDEGREIVNNAGCEMLTNGYARDRSMDVVHAMGDFVPVDVFAWSGGAVLLRREYLDDVGLLDARFFLYYEDIDLSWRGRSRGWRYRFVPASIVHHHHAATVGVGSAIHRYYTERNRLLTLIKNAPFGMVAREMLRFPLSTASYLLADAVVPLARGHRPRLGNVALRIRAFGGVLRHAPYALRARRRIARRRTVQPQRVAAELVRDRSRRRA
ncbi:MAG TPA: glycosyltransferase family 2 protein [Acidimicrobiales bacterium]|nr:glycosyltransferase family 2 protein [Acidimicrobiales bacterium]